MPPVHKASWAGQHCYASLGAWPEVNPGDERLGTELCSLSRVPLCSSVPTDYSPSRRRSPQCPAPRSAVPPGLRGRRRRPLLSSPRPRPAACLALTLTRCCRAGFTAAIRLSWATASKMEGRSSPAEAAVRWAPSSAMAPAAPRPAARGSPRPAGHPPGAAEHRPPEARRGRRSVSARAPLWWQGRGRSRRGRVYSRSSRVLPALPLRFRFRRRPHSGVSVPPP